MHNMARKLTGYTGKGVGVFDLSARPDMYTEPQAATIVLHDQDEHERVFTESEVRAIIARLPVQAMVGTPCVMLEDIAPAFGLSDPA